MCPSLAAAVAFRHSGQPRMQRLDCALSQVTGRARSPSPSGTAQKHYNNWRHSLGERAGSIRVSPGHAANGWAQHGGREVALETRFDFWRQLKESCQGLIISGCHAWHLYLNASSAIATMLDLSLELIDIGGCSPELTGKPGINVSLFLPPLRAADFYATGELSLRLRPDVQTNCPSLRTPALLSAAATIAKPPGSRVDASGCQWLRATLQARWH